jgi:hypothetical protein
VELLGPDGLLSQVTKAVLERALAEEMTGHLGYEKHDPAGRGSGNSRNGASGKTVLTDIGAVDVAVPRDRNGSFEPQIVRKGQTRLKGFNERIIALYARVILSFRVSRGCDLRRPVVDSVADGTLAACLRLFQQPGSLPDRVRAGRWSPRARASWRRSRAFSPASCLLRSRAVVSLARRDASLARWAAGMAPAEPMPLVFSRSLRIWSLMSGWV